MTGRFCGRQDSAFWRHRRQLDQTPSGIELVDFTGRELHPGKRGKIEASEPKTLTKLGLNKYHWTTRVKGIGSGYWRVVGELEELIDKAKEISQRTLFGLGFARILRKI